MAYRDLLPGADSLAVDFSDAGLTKEQQQRVFDSTAHFLNEYAEYYQNEYERVGEKGDKGAQEALTEIVDMFTSEARYSTAQES